MNGNALWAGSNNNITDCDFITDVILLHVSVWTFGCPETLSKKTVLRGVVLCFSVFHSIYTAQSRFTILKGNRIFFSMVSEH